MKRLALQKLNELFVTSKIFDVSISYEKNLVNLKNWYYLQCHAQT
jgi:hypothetical protein